MASQVEDKSGNRNFGGGTELSGVQMKKMPYLSVYFRRNSPVTHRVHWDEAAGHQGGEELLFVLEIGQ